MLAPSAAELPHGNTSTQAATINRFFHHGINAHGAYIRVEE
jgi:hypothetical protein